MSYPPFIADATMFPAPPPIALVGECPLSVRKCALATLTLHGHRTVASFDAPAVQPLASNAPGRYIIAPVVESFPIAWTLTGPEYIEVLRIEVYRRGDAQPVWTRRLPFDADARQAGGSVQFNGDLSSNVQLDLASFPHRVLTAEHAPYKLVLRIEQTTANTQVECAARWIYLDVVVHDIALHLETAAWLPPATAPYMDAAVDALLPAAAAVYMRQRYRLLAADALTGLHADLPNGDLGEAAPSANIRIAMNVFSRSVTDFYTNAVFAGQKLVYGDGPTLPLRAVVRLRSSDGTAADAQAGSQALGNLRLVWDWESGVRPPHPNQAAEKYIADAVAYKPRDWPSARSNCHADHGGKRGLNGGAHFKALPANTLGAAANLVAPMGNRPWATSSAMITDSADPAAGNAGVLFLPSSIAGDTYRLSVYLAYPDLAAFDVAAAEALQTAASNSASVRSGALLTVRHRIDIAHQWRKNQQVDATALDWARLQTYFDAVGVDVRLPPQQSEDMDPLMYDHVAQVIRQSLDLAHRFSMDPAAIQQDGGYGITCVEYDVFFANVLAHVNNIRAAFPVPAVQAMPSDIAFRAAQLNLFNLQRPDGYHLTDLIVPTRADIARTPEACCARLLEILKIRDSGSYRERCKEWSDVILAALCSLHARIEATDTPGIHLYHFDFINQWLHQNDVAEATTSISNFPNCPACQTPTPLEVSPTVNRNCTNNACGLRLDQSAIVSSFVPFRFMNGTEDALSAQLTFKQRIKIKIGRQLGTSAAASIAHEIGHQLGMPHAGPHAFGVLPVMRTGGIHPQFHDAADDACIMSYNINKARMLHFCGVCSLRIAGWSVGRSRTGAPDVAQDMTTVPLSNHGTLNQALEPLSAAQRQYPVPAVCPTCTQAYGPFRQAHFCSLCGLAHCSKHPLHLRPVRNPLKANPVTHVRVCDDCNALPDQLRPPPGAHWEVDDLTTHCSAANCTVKLSEGKHHCFRCGRIFCQAHSSQERDVENALSKEGQTSLQPVCASCNALYLA